MGIASVTRCREYNLLSRVDHGRPPEVVPWARLYSYVSWRGSCGSEGSEAEPSEPPEPYGPRGSDLLAVGPPDPLSWQHVFRQASRLL
jgi:hypothetical protein